jgi:hypothetical protein
LDRRSDDNAARLAHDGGMHFMFFSEYETAPVPSGMDLAAVARTIRSGIAPFRALDEYGLDDVFAERPDALTALGSDPVLRSAIAGFRDTA